MRKYDYAIVIGRFQPIHEGHRILFQKALETADQVIVLCGSANQARTIKNPWRIFDRERMICLAFPDDVSRLNIRGINDYPYNDQQWTLEVQKNVDSLIYNGYKDFPKVCLLGHKKDSETEEYLNMFPQYDYIEVKQEGPLDATHVREMYFDTNDALFEKATKDVICSPVKKFLNSWKETNDYKALQEEWNFIIDYKKLWKFAPYEPTFVTTDAVIIESGHILMIQRGEHPGKGQWALPGGYLEGNERILDSCIREVYEETGLKVPVKILRGTVSEPKRVFDKIDRDPRGRFITHAFLFNLPPCPTAKFTHIKGGDDAVRAVWKPLSEVQSMKDQIFLDHYDIIFTMLGEI